jgi:hypothetical protein
MLIRTTLIGLMVLAASAIAQPPGGGRGPGRFGPGPEPGGFGGARFLGAEAGMPGRVVKNAPYSADVVTENTHTLADGNRIRQTSTVKVYRDSEGRTRNEQSLKTLNGLAPNANLPEIVFINDPVGGANYALNPTGRTATRSTWARPAAATGQGRGMGRGQGRPASPEVAGTGQGQGRGPRRGGANPNVKTEALGSQLVEGVQADGTRTTMTIPAGEIGNEMAIQIVTETWYSQELKTMVLSRRTDPRMGETVTRMTNVSRSEPPATLFQVPVDFKVNDAPSRGGRGSRQ